MLRLLSPGLSVVEAPFPYRFHKRFFTVPQKEGKSDMTLDIQVTLLQVFEQVRSNPDTSPPVFTDGWEEGSAEWRLLESFCGMVGQVQARIQQIKQTEEQLREQEEQ